MLDELCKSSTERDLAKEAHITQKEIDAACGMKDGHPCSYNDIELVDDLPVEEQDALLNWIRCGLVAAKSKTTPRNSYGLKHIYENQTGNYVTNNQFKDAMLICGFKPVHEHRLNWDYYLKAGSPALVENKKRFRDGRR